MYEKACPLVMISISISTEKCISAGSLPLLSPFTTHIATRYKLYFANSLATVFSEPAL